MVAPLQAQDSAGITGQYFGKFNLTMNTPANSGAPYLWRVDTTWPADGSAWSYGILGWGEGAQQYWLWDFDNNVVRLGGGSLLAMNLLAPTFQFYSTARQKIAGQTQPEPGDIPASELQGTLVPNDDGTYTLKMNFAIYLQLANFPHAPIQSRYRVQRHSDGSLSIAALDDAPDGVDIPEDFLNGTRPMEYGPNGYQPAGGSRSDGIPGTVLASAFEDPQRGVFPFRVSPQLDSDRLVKINPAQDCNNDGLPDAVAISLGLDPCLLDNRGDGERDVNLLGSNWQKPIDTDGDGVPDVFEGRADGNNTKVARNIRLPNNERITATVLNKDRFGAVAFPQGIQVKALEPRWLGQPDSLLSMRNDIPSPLPQADAQGNAYRYLGRVRLHFTQQHVPATAYWGLWNIVQITASAETNLASAEQQLLDARARLAQDPSNATLIRLVGTRESAVTRNQTALVTAREQTASQLELYQAYFKEQLGDDFAAVTTLAQLDALLSSKGINPNTDLQDLPPIQISFAQGIPAGLKLFDIKDSAAKVALPANQLPQSQDAELRSAAAWTPVVGTVSYVTIDDKTIQLTGVEHDPRVYPHGTLDTFNGNLDVDVQPQILASAYLGLVFAYTGEERSVVYGVPATPEPETPAEPETPSTPITPPVQSSGGSGGGAFGGALAGLGMVLLALRRRIVTTHR